MVTATVVANLHHKHGYSNVQLCIVYGQFWACACGGFRWLVVLKFVPVNPHQ